jgi:hypothetical protein
MGQEEMGYAERPVAFRVFVAATERAVAERSEREASAHTGSSDTQKRAAETISWNSNAATWRKMPA